jgi:hypothetical protein
LPLLQVVGGVERVNYCRPIIDGNEYEALFWYRLPSGTTTARYETKLRQFLDATIHRSNNGAVVLVATRAGNPDRGEAVDTLLHFATALAPVLDEYLP